MTKFEEWQRQLKLYNATIEKAEAELERVTEERDIFLKETIGFRPRDVATLEGTAELVSKIVDMKM